jgi:neutral/alkaline ceramidase-like enzyme
MRRGVLPVAALLAVLTAALITPGSAAASTPLRVGVGRADITWHIGAERLEPVTANLPELAGQDVPADPLQFAGLHTRVEAKAVVVEAPDGPFAFVRADILLVTGDLYEAVALRVERALGISPDRLLVAATHTHVSNNGLFPHFVHGALYRSPDPREKEFIAGRIADAVVEAAGSMRPARLAVGSGNVTVPALNRRYTRRESLGLPPYGNDVSRLDPQLGVLRFDDATTGRPLAVLMNYGLHPVVLIENPLVSSDFVGLAERMVEREAEVPMAIWLTGAQGDQDPVTVRTSYPEAEWTARHFGAEAARVAKTLQTEPLLDAGIAEKVIPLPPPGGEPIASSEIAGPRLPVAGPAPLLIPSSARLQAIKLSTASQTTVLLSWPGEPIRDLGVALKTRAAALGFDHAFILALADEWAGYWLTPEEYDRGLYERTLMFYGRDSARSVSDQLLDLATSLATGSTIEQVSLPPIAAADRAETRALAELGYSMREVLAGAHAPPPDQEPMVLSEPASVDRPGVATFVWQGGSPDVVRDWIPRVLVQRDTGGTWETVAREGTGDVILTVSTPAIGENHWTARWQTLLNEVPGSYRFLVEGRRQDVGGDVAYSIASMPFDVRACNCIKDIVLDSLPGGGGIHLTVRASYAAPSGGFRLLPGTVGSGNALVEILDGSGDVVATLSLPFISNIVPVARTITVDDVSTEFLPVAIVEPTETGAFEGDWTGAGGITYRVVSVTDAYGNVNA